MPYVPNESIHHLRFIDDTPLEPLSHLSDGLFILLCKCDTSVLSYFEEEYECSISCGTPVSLK